ncbi:MAG TPA: hypothetical protein VN260_06125, partial [Dissulfurispiraceae bacterium]|nr:hypothetical protein [Dissulfurispiraceae bacterium]
CGTFLLFFLVMALFPFCHCHAEDHRPDRNCGGWKSSGEPVPLFGAQHDCEAHKEKQAHQKEHHVHFLVEDEAAPISYYQNGGPPPSQETATIEDFFPHVPAGPCAGVVPDRPRLRGEALFLADRSGLSPPPA